MASVTKLSAGQKKPLAIEEARSVIAALAKDSGNIYYTKHALERMQERDVLATDVIRILREGVIKDVPEKRDEHVYWSYKVEYIKFSELKDRACVVAIKEKKLFIITVI